MNRLAFIIPFLCFFLPLHDALATVACADVVASWNFKHIVHLDKVRGFNAVNLVEGYPLAAGTDLSHEKDL